MEYRIAILCMFLTGMSNSAARADEPRSGAERYVLKFEPGQRDSKIGPSFSPYAKQVPLSASQRDGLAGYDHLVGRLQLGSPGGTPAIGQAIVVARGEPKGPYDILVVDTDFDGEFADEEPLTTKSNVRRGKTWSSFSSSVRVPHLEEGRTVYEEYPLSFWIVVEDPAVAPKIIRFTRRGFLRAPVKIGGEKFLVMLADGNNDGNLGEKDSWGIVPAEREQRWAKSRKVGDFAWANRRAWMLQLEGTRGRRGTLVQHDPGLTEAEDTQQRDRYLEDRRAPRAKQPLTFRRDVDAAIAEAKQQGRRCFLDFETTWCGPCKMMDQLVYTARPAVDAAEGIVCIKIDGDERKDLTRRFKVVGYPTGILLGADGKETARFSGYQSVKEIVAFLGESRK